LFPRIDVRKNQPVPASIKYDPGVSTFENLAPPRDVSVGWKIDPLNGLQYRWWDGRSWTEHAGVGPAPEQPRMTSVLRADIELAAQRMHVTAGAKREIARLRDVLRDGERVLEMTRGELDGRTGLLALTDQRLIYLSDDAQSAHEQYFAIDTVTMVSFTGGMISGNLAIGFADHRLDLTSVTKSDGKRLVAAAQRFIRPAEPVPATTQGETPAADPYRVLRSSDQFWRRSNQMKVLNTDLTEQLGCGESLGARLWRIEPGQASTMHRHRLTTEVYLLLEGTGKLRIGEESIELAPMDTVVVEPGTLRQPFNDTDADQLWLVFGAPPEAANTVDMSEAELAWHYPDGPQSLPPELT